MADAPPAASGQRSVTLDIGAIGSGLGDGIDIEEAYRLVAAAMENDAELMAAVGAARERAVETVRGNLAAKSARRRARGIPPRAGRRVRGHMRRPDGIDGHDGIADQKNTFNSAFDAFAAANASIYKSSADFRARVRRPAREARPCRAREPRARRFRCAIAHLGLHRGALTRAGRQDDLLAPRPQGL